MKKSQLRLIVITIAATVFFQSVKAGNPQRVGSAGAPELLINPWARSGGWGSVNIAGVQGIEATFLNIAGTSFTKKTDISFTHTQWLIGADISINAVGFAQKVGGTGVLSASFVSFDYGEWKRTTNDMPFSGLGTVSPTTVNISLGYAQRFTESIRGGINLKLYSQLSDNLAANALSADAGVQYVTGSKEELKFGITLKNVGSSVSFSGDGKSVVLPVPQAGYSQAYNERSASFELPATLSIGGSYDLNFLSQRLTFAGAFQSNSFEKDRYTIGSEYSIKEIVEARVGYTFYDDRVYESQTTVFTGLSAGISFNVPVVGSDFVIDYSYRATNKFNGVHSIGLGFEL